MSYCSLEEAWGDNYVETKESTPEEVKPNKDVSYSGGKQFSTDLLPQTQNQDIYEDSSKGPSHTTMGQSGNNSGLHQTNLPPDYLNNKEKYAIVPYNLDKEQLWDEFLEYVKQKNQAQQQQQQNVEGFSGIGNFASVRQPVENKKDNSYVDLLILIMFGIIVIFILDSFVRFGRKSKRD